MVSIAICMAFSPGTKESSECYNKTMFMIVRPTVKYSTPMKMNKTNSQLIASLLTPDNPEIITSWQPDSLYPDTIIVNNGLQVNSSSGNIRIYGSMTMSVITAAEHSRGLHIFSNGVKIAEQTIYGFTTNFEIDVIVPASRQLLTLRAHATASNTSNRNITAASIRYERV